MLAQEILFLLKKLDFLPKAIKILFKKVKFCYFLLLNMVKI